ncbi:MAG: glycoside hydrolase family 2 [Clostridia bacterium]|nr:glycoside hydrolase family 2 [Clostridia bacterium]
MTEQDRKEELSKLCPLKIQPRHFYPSSQKVEPIQERSYEENLEKFKKELLKLKEKYQPFLANHTPKPKVSRQGWHQTSFEFRYEQKEDRKDFSRILKGKGEWEKVIIPDYRGPPGKWTGFYREEFTFKEKRKPEKRMFLRFLGVDYVGHIYLNARFVGSHEGFFAPFEFDVTDLLHFEGDNVLLVEVKNDAPTLGLEILDKKQNIDGDKIYAATGPGWDDPILGWHHCPPGAGIYNKVILEQRPPLFIHSLFVRPDIDNSLIEAWVEVFHTENHNQQFELKLSLYPKNFQGKTLVNIPCQVEPAGPGLNYYRFKIPLSQYRLWNPEEPWLYTLRASIIRERELQDEKDCQFGMRKFHMDEKEKLKGTLYLNNKPIILRGANEMGHLQQCVMKEDYQQLINDILIAKLAHLNYYRITQRPVQKEIYEYFDMLGMMHQCDLPLFGYLRRNQFSEALRQAGEMERLIRPHPSSIMVTFINEPFPPTKEKKEHRDLYRNELEAFFEAARKVIWIENPDRVVKNVEGDYDPPTRTGLSDFHCYTLWYTNHSMPIGKLHKGYLQALKKGWKTGCGEYGTEGLDPLSVMLKDYPKEWLPKNIEDPWRPGKIIKAQTYDMHGDWYEEQYRIQDWIRESQAHQAFATRMMSDALRRRSDIIVSTALHLLIDAWPSGWMKALVAHNRVPKPAYFALQKSMEPVRINLRTDRFKMYGGQRIEIEAWVLNDTDVDLQGYKIVATLRKKDENYGSFEIDVEAKSSISTYAGTISFDAPRVRDRETFYLDAALLDSEANIVNCERIALEAFEKEIKPSHTTIMYVGRDIKDFLEKLNITTIPYQKEGKRAEGILINSWEEYQKKSHSLLKWVAEGSKALFLLNDMGKDRVEIEDTIIYLKEMAGGLTGITETGLTFVARNANESITRGFGPKDFSFWYNEEKDHIDFIAKKYMDCHGITPLLFTHQKPTLHIIEIAKSKGLKKKLPIVGYMPYGKGELIFSTLCLKGFVGVNPVLDRFLKKLL